MDFEWDEAKSDACFDQRGFDFPHVAQVFLNDQRVVRIISARKANLREVKFYENGAF